jgi:hypothetical protein
MTHEQGGNPMHPTSIRRTLSATSLAGDVVRDTTGEQLGKLEDIMIDLNTGRIAYAVLSCGSAMGIADALFAVPWCALELDEQQHQLVLDVPKHRLRNAPRFDKDHWPNMADAEWGRAIYEYYGKKFLLD